FLLELWQNIPTNGGPSEPPRGRGGAFTRLHHVGLVCTSLEEPLHLFRDIYGLDVNETRTPLPDGRYATSDNVRILEFTIGESEIEVTVPQDDASGTARFLASRGQGIHHICFYTEDIEYDVNRLKVAGMQQLGQLSPAQPGTNRVAFFHPRSNMGVLVELWQDIPAA
ncbi:MAG: VOC family protein, partial [Dehalococcoidia bacterium]